MPIQNDKRYQPFTENDGLHVGEDITITFPLLDDDNDPVSTGGSTYELKVGSAQGQAAVVTVAGTPTGNVISVALTAANMNTIGAGSHWYTLSRTSAGSNRVLAFGEFIVSARLS